MRPITFLSATDIHDRDHHVRVNTYIIRVGIGGRTTELWLTQEEASSLQKQMASSNPRGSDPDLGLSRRRCRDCLKAATRQCLRAKLAGIADKVQRFCDDHGELCCEKIVKRGQQ